MPLNWFQIAIGAVPALAIAFLIHTVDVNRIESNWQDKLDAQETELENECQADKDITTNSDTKYEALYTDLLADFKRLRDKPTYCIPVAKPTCSGNATNGKNQSSQANGITATALYDYAGECEIDRIKVTVLQGYINAIFAKKSR